MAHGEAGQPVFRLNHEALAGHVLRVCGIPDPQAHATMVAVLRHVHGELYRGRGATNPYVARYVPAHAARAGALAGLLKDAELLVRLDPERLVAQLDQPGAAASAQAQLYRPVAEDLARKSPQERAALLQAQALRQQPELMPWARSAAPLHWTDQWTTAERSAPSAPCGCRSETSSWCVRARTAASTPQVNACGTGAAPVAGPTTCAATCPPRSVERRIG
ncbi:hypothetical protein O1M54_00015 [Streptomyces diastatochromogenes]|nr:hypothetical protein [Streptomyces diastatochromogenes]